MFLFRRHVLSLRLTSPVAYHLQIVSAATFYVGDEEVILPLLTKVRTNSLERLLANVVPSFVRYIYNIV